MRGCGSGRVWLLVVADICGMAIARDASGYSSMSHKQLTRLAADIAATDYGVPLPRMRADLIDDFRRHLYSILASLPDDGPSFLERYPVQESFGADDLKSLLGLRRGPGRPIQGFDILQNDGHRVMDVLIRECTRPDEDARNQSRFAYTEDGNKLSGALGPYPEDPAILDMGSVSGLSSQAHAHYALARDGLSGLPWKLWTEPQHFFVGRYGLTFGPQMARAYFLLSLLASSMDRPDAKRLAYVYLGHALHHVQDASDPLHTVQVGSPCVAFEAVMAFVGRALLTFGGFIGSLRPLTSIAADVVANHHLFVEALWEAEGVCKRPEPRPKTRLRPGEVGLAQALVLADEGSDMVRPLGPEVYAAACKAADLGGYGHVLQDGAFDPEHMVRDQEAKARILAIGRRAAGVAVLQSARLLRAFEDLSAKMHDSDFAREVARRFLHERLKLLAEREARLRAFIRENPDGVPLGQARVRYWLMVMSEFAVFFLGGFLFSRRFGRLKEK